MKPKFKLGQLVYFVNYKTLDKATVTGISQYKGLVKLEDTKYEFTKYEYDLETVTTSECNTVEETELYDVVDGTAKLPKNFSLIKEA